MIDTNVEIVCTKLAFELKIILPDAIALINLSASAGLIWNGAQGTTVYSEIYLKDGTMLRASPDFKGGPWRDWVTVQIEDPPHPETGEGFECPYQLFGFVHDKEGKVTGIGQAGDYSKPPTIDNQLLSTWKMLKGCPGSFEPAAN